jgi:hypothetical protein
MNSSYQTYYNSATIVTQRLIVYSDLKKINNKGPQSGPKKLVHNNNKILSLIYSQRNFGPGVKEESQPLSAVACARQMFASIFLRITLYMAAAAAAVEFEGCRVMKNFPHKSTWRKGEEKKPNGTEGGGTLNVVLVLVHLVRSWVEFVIVVEF